MKRLQALPTSELTEVINLFPWFSAARVELAKRKFRTGEAGFAEAALYIGSRKLLYDIAKGQDDKDYWDKDVEEILREAPKRKVRALGGDFFSQDQYDDVRQDGDNVFSGIAARIQPSRPETENDDILLHFCTETLAQIYIEQGYYAQAREIYSKLSLRYPEKNAYFAAQIEKLDKLESN